MQNLNLCETLKILEQFSSIERRVDRGSKQRPENDTEHSYDLAIVALGIIRNDRLPLDEAKVLRYALVHDFTEVYAGDTFALDSEARIGKEGRERVALERIKANTTINFLVSDIQEYESMKSEEARFVHALDKLLPAFQIINARQTLHKDNGMTIEGWKELFVPKIRVSKHLEPYLADLIGLQEANLDLFA